MELLPRLQFFRTNRLRVARSKFEMKSWIASWMHISIISFWKEIAGRTLLIAQNRVKPTAVGKMEIKAMEAQIGWSPWKKM
jgi:hypothetical protein